MRSQHQLLEQGAPSCWGRSVVCSQTVTWEEDKRGLVCVWTWTEELWQALKGSVNMCTLVNLESAVYAYTSELLFLPEGR